MCIFCIFLGAQELAVQELQYMALFWNRIESSLASALVILVQLVEMHTW